jgi:hypothetical protein
VIERGAGYEIAHFKNPSWLILAKEFLQGKEYFLFQVTNVVQLHRKCNIAETIYRK